MNLWNENRLIDIMGHADPALLEGDFPGVRSGKGNSPDVDGAKTQQKTHCAGSWRGGRLSCADRGSTSGGQEA